MKIFWLTGLPCSGKTTIARQLSRHLNATVLDGDDIRKIMNNNDFSEKGRAQHMRSVAYIASLLSQNTNVVVALVSPLKKAREELKQRYPNILEIYIKCDIQVCKNRDVKGLYKKAINGEITNFTGVQVSYEPPFSPDLVVETDKLSVKECVEKILALYDWNPKALIIGRWQPFHKGHKWLVDRVKSFGHKPIIGIRHTRINEKNPYSVQERIEMIKEVLGKNAEYVVLPDIAGVYYGRDVGYEVREIIPPKSIGAISGTKLRNIKNS